MVAAKIDNAMRIYALDALASKFGLSVGQPLANARAMIDPLEVIEADEAADAKLLEQIADWCDRFTPFVAINPPDGLFLDVTGVTHLFGGEASMLATVTDALRKQRFAVCGALAGTAVAARALARYVPGTIANPGEEAKAVATLPVAALGVDSSITHALRRAGLKTIGQIATRQRSELASRFGKKFVSALEQALGHNESPISPRAPLPDYMAEHSFAEPVTADAVIFATLRSLAGSLAQIMEQRGQGARALEATFFRADGMMRRIVIETGSATCDPAVIERLFRTKLEALANPLDPGFGFDLIRLGATLTQRADAEIAGLENDHKPERQIKELIDSLSARFGAHRVLRFIPQDTHIPEAASTTVPAQSEMHTNLAWRRKGTASDGSSRPIKLFAKPEPIDVIAQVPEGPPLRFRWRRVLHTAAFAEGPERIEMEWWRHQEAMPVRDYFRVQDSEGRRFWLFREGLYARQTTNPRWYMHGLFA